MLPPSTRKNPEAAFQRLAPITMSVVSPQQVRLDEAVKLTVSRRFSD